MNTPILSIAMTTYNGEQFLQEQLDSIINQSFSDYELIICDDKSTDATISIIQAYQKKHSNISLYLNPIRLGSVKNFEKAITLCNSKYIALSDQDDIWEKDKLQVQIQAIKELELQDSTTPLMVHSDLQMIDEKNRVLQLSYFKYKNYKLKNTKDISHMLGPCGVMGNTILINQKLKEKILPFPENIIVHDYWIALVNETQGQRATINRPLVKYRIHSTNFSNSKTKVQNTPFTKIKQIVLKKCNLPYTNLKRELLLKEFLLKYQLLDSDKVIIEKFLDYLENREKNKIKKIINSIKYDYIKRSFIYRVQFTLLVLFCSNRIK